MRNQRSLIGALWLCCQSLGHRLVYFISTQHPQSMVADTLWFAKIISVVWKFNLSGSWIYYLGYFMLLCLSSFFSLLVKFSARVPTVSCQAYLAWFSWAIFLDVFSNWEFFDKQLPFSSSRWLTIGTGDLFCKCCIGTQFVDTFSRTNLKFDHILRSRFPIVCLYNWAGLPWYWIWQVGSPLFRVNKCLWTTCKASDTGAITVFTVRLSW